MSIWKKYKFKERILKILKGIKYCRNHHFGRPFLTAYQIAIEYSKSYTEDFKKIGKPVGGKDTGKHNSLSQYIARELSRRMKPKGELFGLIEGGFISNDYLVELRFDSVKEKKKIKSSLTKTDYDLSMFRLKK